MKTLLSVLVGFALNYIVQWRLGRKFLYPRMDREIDTTGKRLSRYWNHWYAEARGLGHKGSALTCNEC